MENPLRSLIDRTSYFIQLARFSIRLRFEYIVLVLHFNVFIAENKSSRFACVYIMIASAKVCGDLFVAKEVQTGRTLRK